MTKQESKLQKKAAAANPFDHGLQTALRGQTINTCPFDRHDKQFTRWLCGFQAGAAQIAKEKNVHVR